MRNSEVARVFDGLADLLELKGENPFKIRAYRKAADSIEHLSSDISQMVADDKLREIPGVGGAIALKITEIVTTGKLSLYEKVKSELPEGVTNLLLIPGVGPRTAMLLASELGIKTVDELESAIVSGRVAQLPKMGEKSAENILHQVQALKRKSQRIPVYVALPVVDEILRAMPSVTLIPAGSLRRFQDTVGNIDIVGAADNPLEIIQAFVSLPIVKGVLTSSDTSASVVVSGGIRVDLRLVAPDAFGSFLQYYTGSKQHNVILRERAQRVGLQLSEHGIVDQATGKLERFATEEGLYRRLGLQFIPPELREGRDEIERAGKGALPDLIQLTDIRGDLHVHSEWSDGHDSIDTMATAARALGYRYLAITDHSRGLGIARGLDVERLRRQVAEIGALNQRLEGIHIFTGAEVDIRADGTLDLPREMLADMDIVIAAIHSAMNQGREEMTARVIRALEDPDVDILAHPTCRLLPDREPVAIDMEAVFQAAVRNNKALEINAMTSRLDLGDTDVYRAREMGVNLVIGTDAHRKEHLEFMRFGIGIARRGWCEARDLINTRPLEELLPVVMMNQ